MLRIVSLFWIALSVLMIVVGASGVADAWLHTAASCGADGEIARTCRPGEAQHALVIVGSISLAAGLVELALLPRLKGLWSL